MAHIGIHGRQTYIESHEGRSLRQLVDYAKEQHPYAIERYTNEMLRLLAVMDNHLEEREWFAGDSYSIADMTDHVIRVLKTRPDVLETRP